MVRGSEILEVLHSLPDIRQYLFCLYNCQYADFFKVLGKGEQADDEELIFDKYFKHSNFLVHLFARLENLYIFVPI